MQHEREWDELEELKAEFAVRVANAVEAFQAGGPDLEAELDREAGQLPEEIQVECRAANRRAWRRVKPAAEVVAEPKVVGAPKVMRWFPKPEAEPPPRSKENATEELRPPETEVASSVSGGTRSEPEAGKINLRDWYEANKAKLATKVKPEPEPQPEEPEPEPEAEPIKAGLPVVVPPAPPLSKWDSAIAAMNEQHAIIENVCGKTMIASWEPSPIDLERKMVVFQSKESFLLRYSNRTVSIEVPALRGGIRLETAPLGQWWLGHRDRLQFRGVTFRPGGTKVVSECLNLWQGWGVEPRPGDWELIREHIKEVIAGGNEEFAEYVIRWIAWSIQNPAAQAEVALVLIGPKGVGKGTLVRLLQRIFGAHAFQVTSREEVIGKFNGHLENCVLFVADEAYWGGDKRCVGRLQGMITEPTLPIERKGFDIISVPNYLHVVMLAEPGWVIPAGRFERRYAALSVSDRRRGDRQYFNALHRQIAEGGAEAMMWDLQRMDLDGWHPREIPESLLKGSALQRQQTYTLPPLEQWYLGLLSDGRIPGALINNDPLSKRLSRPSTAYTKSLREDACERFPRLKWELSDIMLEDFLTDENWMKAKKFRDAKRNGWTFEPLTQSRAEWDRRYGPQPWNERKEWDPGPRAWEG